MGPLGTGGRAGKSTMKTGGLGRASNSTASAPARCSIVAAATVPVLRPSAPGNPWTATAMRGLLA